MPKLHLLKLVERFLKKTHTQKKNDRNLPLPQMLTVLPGPFWTGLRVSTTLKRLMLQKLKGCRTNVKTLNYSATHLLIG